jgi:hypothetical protein
MPRGDLVEHETDEACACGPTLNTERPAGTAPCACGCTDGTAGVAWIHHSLDGREATE